MQLKYATTKKDRINSLKKLSELSSYNAQTSCILAKIYMEGEYGLKVSHLTALRYCKRYLLNFAALLPADKLPNEYLIIPLTLKQLSSQSETAATLNIYYKFLSACYTDNPDKIKKFCNAPKTSLRPLIMKILSAKHQDFDAYLKKVKNIKHTAKKLKDFYDSDGSIALLLLKQRLEALADKTSPLANALNYFLGICAYHEQNYLQAHEYFMQCNHYYNDLLTQCLIVDTYNRAHSTTILDNIDKLFTKIEDLLPLLAVADLCLQPRNRDTYAKTILSNLLQDIYLHYHEQLLEKKEALPLSRLTYYMMHLPETQEIACKLLTKIINFINPTISLHSDQKEIRNYQYKTYILLANLAATKDHMSYLCNTAGAQMLERIYNTHHSDEKYNILKEKALAHYVCALTHTNCSKELTQSIKFNCASLSYDLGKAYKSLNYIEQAIIFGNPKAFRLKATYLLQQPNAQENLQQARDLFTLHIETDDPKKSYSYNELAFYLSSTKSLENDKKAFHYLHQAIDLGNYDYAWLLGKFYASGIQEKNKQYYIHPNLRHTIHYYTEHITQTNNQFIEETFFHRGLTYYKLNCFDEAYNDFNENLLRTKDLKRQAVSLFMKSIINIQREENSIPYPSAIEDLRTAHQKIKAYNKSINLEVPIKPEFFVQYMDEKAFIAVEALLMNIVNTKNSSVDALDWCEFMGYLFWKSVEQAPLDNTRRKSTISFLTYAADKNMPRAQWALSFTHEQEITLSKKVGYLSSLLANIKPDNYDLRLPIKDRLTTLFPLASEKQEEPCFPDKLIRNELTPLLFISLQSPDSKNSKFLNAILTFSSSDNEKNSTMCMRTLKQLAKRKPPHIHASLMMAIQLCASQPDGIEAEIYMKNAIITGLVVQKKKPTFFKDELMLDLTFQLITKCLINEKAIPPGPRLLKMLKAILTEKKVNIDAFTALLKDSYKYDLTKNHAWH